jgi:HSP20 family protein
MAEARNDREQQTQAQKETSMQRQSAQSRGDVQRRSGRDYASNPFELMRRLTEQMFGPGLGRLVEESWAPQIEVFERDGKLVVRADLPGMTKDDVRAEVRDNSLILEGERRQEKKEDREGLFVTERTYGKFYRVIPLPEGVNGDSAQATFRDGVLELTMDAPKKEQRGKSIPIEAQKS